MYNFDGTSFQCDDEIQNDSGKRLTLFFRQGPVCLAGCQTLSLWEKFTTR